MKRENLIQRTVIYQQIVLELFDIYIQKINFDSCLMPHIHNCIKTKWIINQNIKLKIIKILEENIGKNTYDIGLGKDSLDIKI